MRGTETRDGIRQTGYALILAIVLLAVFCLLTGDEWAAGGLAAAAAVAFGGVEAVRRIASRRLARQPRPLFQPEQISAK